MAIARHRTRSEIIDDLTTLRDDIQGIFDDAAHWNRLHPESQPIDPDEDGNMRAMLDSLNTMLAADPGHGKIAPFKPEGWPFS